jgi:hypothetical protein
VSATRTVTAWPEAAALRAQFAEQARRVARERQAVTGWSDEETGRQVRAAAAEAAECVALALIEAAEMGLDLWQATR